MPKLHYEYNPMFGVRDDFLTVMNEFFELKTVRFSEFSKVWRSNTMSYLCAGRCSDRETREFIERSFLIILEFFLPPFQFQVRVCGLYLLYALFETQPIAPKVKVRLTQAQWKEARSFQQEAAQQNHLDVVYIFNKMIQDNAFHFCLTNSEISVRTHLHETENPSLNLTEGMKEDRRVIDTLFNYEAMEKLSYLLDHYQQMKVNLSGPEAKQPDKSLDVVQGKMVEDLVSMLQTFKTVVGNVHRHGKTSVETINEEQQGTPTGDKTASMSSRQALKARAFSQVNTGNKGSRFKMITEESSSNEESPQQQSYELQSADSCIEGEKFTPTFDGHDIIRVEVYSKSNGDWSNIKMTEEASLESADNKCVTVDSCVESKDLSPLSRSIDEGISLPGYCKPGTSGFADQGRASSSMNTNTESNTDNLYLKSAEGHNDQLINLDSLPGVRNNCSNKLAVSQGTTSQEKNKKLNLKETQKSTKGKGKKSKAREIQTDTSDSSPDRVGSKSKKYRKVE